MIKSCLGYKINHEVYCRSCGQYFIEHSTDAVFDLEELHAVSDEECEKCGASLGEPTDE